MAIIVMPSALAVVDFTFGQRRFDLSSPSDANGTSQTRPLGPPRWLCSFRCPPGISEDDFELWETLLLQLRGKVNHLSLWDRRRPVPRGTMRGALTLGSTLAAGATTAVITGGAGQAGTTLRAGDKLGINTGLGTRQLVQVTTGGTADGSGVITVGFEPPARIQHAAGTSVAWNMPVAYFKAMNEEWGGRALSPKVFAGYGLDLLEQFS